MVLLQLDPPKIDWVFQRPDIIKQYGKNPVSVYINKLIQILDWVPKTLTPEQSDMLARIMRECKDSLLKCNSFYVLSGRLLYPKFYDVDLFLRFFEPLATRHLYDMWWITPYVPEMPDASVSNTKILNMLNNVAHLFR